jgi:murein DD-endopeptidase MepM/ murein hydrolase activator NlpD
MFLRVANARVIIGEKLIFQTSDGYLQSVDVVLGENERASSCSVSLYDPELKLLNLFLTQFQVVGGIAVPPGLLEKPPEAAPVAAASGTTTASAANLPAGSLRGDDLARAIIAECLKQGVTMREQIAYILGTVERESDMGRVMVEEGSRTYFNYLEGRKDIGNVNSGDGYKYRGRGYCQVTGRVNYERFTKMFSVDFVNNPDLMADPKYAMPILVISMKNGLTTGRKLSDYIRPGSVDYINARRVVNGTDRAQLIAGYAQKWFTRLDSLGYTGAAPAPVATSTGVPSGTAILATLPGGGTTTPATAVQEIDVSKGVRIIVELGFNDKEAIAYEFLLTEIKGSTDKPHSIKLAGKQLRFVLAKNTSKKFKTYRNTSIRQIAESMAGAIGGSVVADPEASRIIPVVTQQGSDYATLLRLAKAAGLFVRADAKTLKLETLKASDKTFAISKKSLLSGSTFGDSANSDRIIKEVTVPGTKLPTPAPATVPTTTPGEAASGTSATRTKAASEAETGTPATPTTSSGSGVPSGTAILATLPGGGASVGTPGAVTGGIQDLKTKFDEAKGIGKGFEGSLNVNTLLLPEVLSLQPGSIVELLNDSGFGDAIAREYRVSDVRHSYGSSGITSTITIYLPVAVTPKRQQSASNIAASPAANGVATGAAPPFSGNWQATPKRGDTIGGHPVTSPFGPRSSPGGIGSTDHKGVDVSMKNGTPLYCFGKPGEVIDVECRNQGGGAGIYAVFTNSFGYYFHLMHCGSCNAGRYTIGADGMGKVCCFSNNTGSSTGPHLHFGQGSTKGGGYIPPFAGYVYAAITGKVPV